ncbi:MAG: hypothetical protein DMF72_02875 [Acidobacteria bacterium]|nr:MAG: hypothetical protein DMF72_02875 [Acidobacteriota bacterium]
MKSRLLIMPLAAVTLGCLLLIVNAQQDDEVRGAFLSTRPKTTNSNAPVRRHRRPPRNTNSSGSTTAKNANGSKNANSSEATAANANKNFANSNSAASRTESIGLGYTVFMRDVNGRAVRVDPTREFHNGDRIRISLEPNIDGYLYVFHTEGDGAPEMIYPDARLEAGENWIEAHVPMDVPSTIETDERLKWFQFYGNAATEHLYVVVTREPLAEVPMADALVNFCSTNKDKCPWHPTPDVWTKIQQAAKADVKIVTSNTAGQAQSDKEQIATTRGLGLDQTAPQPSVIRMSASTSAPVLVTILDLVHK